MMFFLIHYIFNNIIYCRMRVRKRTIPFLPLKLISWKSFLIYENVRWFLNLPHQIRQSTRRLHTNKEMNMVKTTIYSQHLLPFISEQYRLYIYTTLLPILLWLYCFYPVLQKQLECISVKRCSKYFRYFLRKIHSYIHLPLACWCISMRLHSN